MLNLILGVIWLLTALGIFAYEFFEGPSGLRIRGLGISTGWFFLVLALYNFARWYLSRSGKAEQQSSLHLAHEQRLRQPRYHERPEVPDPNFDFSDKPKPPSNVTEPPKPPGEPDKSGP